MAKTNANSALNMEHLALIKQAIDAAGAAKDITVSTETTSTGMLRSYTFKKGGQNLVVIDIPKDYINSVVGFASEDGEGNPGIFLKVKTNTADQPDTFDYIDASGLVEYLELGDQTGKPVQLTISADHKITGDLADGSVAKAKLVTAVQTSLDNADTAYGWGDHAQAGYIVGEFATDAEVRTALGLPAGE